MFILPFFGYFSLEKLFLELHFPYIIKKKQLSYYMLFFLVKIKIKMRFVFISNQLLKDLSEKIYHQKKHYIIAHSAAEKFLS